MDDNIKGGKTSLLPPISAVHIVWARTGAFSDDLQSQLAAASAETELKRIRRQIEEEKNSKKSENSSTERSRDSCCNSIDAKEREYITNAITAMDAALRSLEIIHKSRELNFKENAEIRELYQESVKENIDFGNKFKDVLKSWPTMTITGLGGTTTIAKFFSDNSSISNFQLAAIGLAMTAAGYIANLGIIKLMRKRKQKLYVKQDYDRNLYFVQYLGRAEVILRSLYSDLELIHENIFGKVYPSKEKEVFIEKMFNGVKPRHCKYIHKHMNEKKITPDLWSLCETGEKDAIEKCPLWESDKNKEGQK